LEKDERMCEMKKWEEEKKCKDERIGGMKHLEG
jgi:hypothetical protein